MLGAVLWVAAFILLAAAAVYALRRHAKAQSPNCVKSDEGAEDATSSVAHIERELQTLMQEVKRKVKKEQADGGYRDG